MIGPAVPAPGVGLAVLLQEGLAAWLGAVCTCTGSVGPPAPTTVATLVPCTERDGTTPIARGPQADLLPPAQYAEATRLLANLVLSVRPLRHPSRTRPGASV